MIILPRDAVFNTKVKPGKLRDILMTLLILMASIILIFGGQQKVTLVAPTPGSGVLPPWLPLLPLHGAMQGTEFLDR